VGVVAGADHHDRHVVGAADLPDALEAVDPGQHQVDQHGVGRAAALHRQPFLGRGGAAHRVALVLQGQHQRQPDPVVVLDHEHC
jgi:hypothetical protein